MGYCTNFTLYIECKDEETFKNIFKHLKDFNEKYDYFEPFEYIFDDELNVNHYISERIPLLNTSNKVYCLESEELYEWYDDENQLSIFSTLFPEVLFILHGEGEEAGDLWEFYMLNEKSKKMFAEIPKPNLEDLQ